MKVVVIGTGHVGLVTAATLAQIGHAVIGVDDDYEKVELLERGHIPFYEAGLGELVDAGRSQGRLRFVHEASVGVPGAQVAFICVGTPGRPGGEPNLVAVERAASSVGHCASSDMVVVEKSTVPVKTAERVKSVLARSSSHRFDVASNPEFLREGRAVEDSLRPDRILVGADSSRGHQVMRELYAPIVQGGAKYFATDLPTAELAKHACNAFLALKISFANGMARICELAGADVVAIADIMGSDPRIGRDFLNAGLGYGGSCFPKDIAAFRAQAARLGYEFTLLDEIVKINDQAVAAAVEKIKDVLWNLEQKRILLLGLAFKPGTDDVRQAPALHLARRLMEGGARVVGYDPRAGDAAAAELAGLEVAEDPYIAAEGADCLVVSTEWPEFRELDLIRLKGVLTHPIIVDCRNLFDPETVGGAGFTYVPTGRPPLNL